MQRDQQTQCATQIDTFRDIAMRAKLQACQGVCMADGVGTHWGPTVTRGWLCSGDHSGACRHWQPRTRNLPSTAGQSAWGQHKSQRSRVSCFIFRSRRFMCWQRPHLNNQKKILGSGPITPGSLHKTVSADLQPSEVQACA